MIEESDSWNIYDAALDEIKAWLRILRCASGCYNHLSHEKDDADIEEYAIYLLDEIEKKNFFSDFLGEGVPDVDWAGGLKEITFASRPNFLIARHHFSFLIKSELGLHGIANTVFSDKPLGYY